MAEPFQKLRQGCFLYLEGAVCAPVSKSPPSVPGSACSYLNECAIGAGCVQVDGKSHCRAYCDYQANPNKADPRCSIEGVCRFLAGGDGLGVCR